ncbi:hypothetical protein AC249_AIPGENE23452 [Exaiptasia diaphana]|nr:hypothetical protein AC249_AIPGENE23452 [Exaiptasia diaphana]
MATSLCCKYSALVGGPCGGSSSNPLELTITTVGECCKEVPGHLRSLKCTDSNVKSESVLLLARAATCKGCRSRLSKEEPSTTSDSVDTQDYDTVAKLSTDVKDLDINTDKVQLNQTLEASLYCPSESSSSSNESPKPEKRGNVNTRRLKLNEFLSISGKEHVKVIKKEWNTSVCALEKIVYVHRQLKCGHNPKAASKKFFQVIAPFFALLQQYNLELELHAKYTPVKHLDASID